MRASDFQQVVYDIHDEARSHGLFFQHCDSYSQDGRVIRTGDRDVVWFGSCSYLGLEREPSLINRSCDMIHRFGTQFSSSRGYVSLDAHRQLEGQLDRIFGGYSVLGQTTTLAHQAAMDVLATEKDAVVLDHQAHVSLQRAATLARARGARIEVIHHDHPERALPLLRELSTKYERVWYATDGVTSMYGEFAPVLLMHEMLGVAPNVHLYVDDAHGTGWGGERGQGRFLEVFGFHDRLVLATSLAKACAAGGAALVVKDSELRDRLRLTGGTMVFSGPLQPALLGAALAACDFMLSSELAPRQRALFDRVRRLKQGLTHHEIPIYANNEAPMTFVYAGLPRVAFEIAHQLLERGHYVNVASFPAVPMRRAGLRITVTTHLEFEDIDRLVEDIADIYPKVLRANDLSINQLREWFSENEAREPRAKLAPVRVATRSPRLPIEHFNSLPPELEDEWDACLGGRGCISAASMRMQEQIFSGGAREHDWTFHYLRVRDGQAPALWTVFVELPGKDDVFSLPELSQLIEVERAARSDPYYLTARVLMMGGGLSEGNHLYLNRDLRWQAALRAVANWAAARYDAGEVEAVLFRDLPADDDDVSALLTAEGFTRVPMPDRHLAEVAGDDPLFLIGEDTRKRRLIRDIRSAHPALDFRALDRAQIAANLETLYTQYLAVAHRTREINMFDLPARVFVAMADNPAWTVVAITHPEHEGILGWYAAHLHGDDFAPLACGIDYLHLSRFNTYRHLMFEVMWSARERGAKLVHLGMLAGREKRRFGSRPEATVAYALRRDTYASAQLELHRQQAMLGIERTSSVIG